MQRRRAGRDFHLLAGEPDVFQGRDQLLRKFAVGNFGGQLAVQEASQPSDGAAGHDLFPQGQGAVQLSPTRPLNEPPRDRAPQ